MSIKIAVVGATGSVGREILNILDERMFPCDEVVALASRKSMGRELSYGDKILKVKNLETYDFSDTDIALFSAGSKISEKWGPIASSAGAIVIDNSSFWRYHDDVPLIVPEVNPDDIKDCKKRGIIANPNCSTSQLVVVLKPLHDFAKITRVVVSTYQSVSGAGNAAMEELFNQTKGIFVNQAAEPENFTRQIAFNVIPHIDIFHDDGYTKEEWKMLSETKKIIDKNIKLTATCVRVPVFVGHSEAVNIEFEKPISPEKARTILRDSPGIMLVDDPEDEKYVTPIECVGDYATFVSRVRADITVKNGLTMWIVSDNLRKGAALNAVQIAELLLNKKYVG
ncbi:aspartate-semialdehyde dehydrogenase [Gammaproteobacteria bacterium]|nr:aspartate-semialdehyde dehydrogenase [Rhodobiaceae bacterium]MDC3084723.1 aspartate-semialdehyde dehydrogenase [Gammaproteobacteria bacterium]OUT82175.1 MAG: aspartate-semialdehyde dehydrogenase [Rhizobiales bacterium TMED28]RZO34326.1 MAG: aspartate-semialdehyde dehydrogenase [Hyphomicrobiales bacterium]